MSRGFPFQAAMGFAVCVLRLGPREAWAMTPREIAMAVKWLGVPDEGAPGRAELQALMARFPDR